MNHLTRSRLLSTAPANLWAGALSQLLSFNETGCPHSARRAAGLLSRLADDPRVDREIAELCERAIQRLDLTGQHARELPRP